MRIMASMRSAFNGAKGRTAARRVASPVGASWSQSEPAGASRSKLEPVDLSSLQVNEFLYSLIFFFFRKKSLKDTLVITVPEAMDEASLGSLLYVLPADVRGS